MIDKSSKAIRTDPPALGERRARWGYGYQDRVATQRILDCLRDDLRRGIESFEGIRLADLRAGRVDDFVLVWKNRVEGNSIKYSRKPAPVNWRDLVGADGLLRQLAEGFLKLTEHWAERDVFVRFHTNRPAATGTHHRQLVPLISLRDFLDQYWPQGPTRTGDSEVWSLIEKHSGLNTADFERFVTSCRFSLGSGQPPLTATNPIDDRQYQKQFDCLHKAIATWVTKHPDSEFIGAELILSAIGLSRSRAGLIQRFPLPRIPYRQNTAAAKKLTAAISDSSGGYITIVGSAGIGKSTLVEDVLTPERFPYFLPYYAFLPQGEGSARDRGESLTFFQDVVVRLDKFFHNRVSIGITDVLQGREALNAHMSSASEQYRSSGRKTILLVDGLDHVAREVGLQRSILFDLPKPEEIPEGFIIILSSQPQALLPGVITPEIASVIAAGSRRRVEVDGLDRPEMHDIISRLTKPTTGEERDQLGEACGGNPLVLTYLLNAFQGSHEATVGSVLAEPGNYVGDIDAYYETALSITLQSSKSRRLLGLLCRAAPAVRIDWILSWPERGPVEDLIHRVLLPFVKLETGTLNFLHDSLVVFLKERTRSPLPGTNPAIEESRFYDELAARTQNYPCSDQLGRAHIRYLLCGGRRQDVLRSLMSLWLRDAIDAYVPWERIRPLLLAGMEAAWEVGDYGEVIRFILLGHELGQRMGRANAKQLADWLLQLNMPELAVSQVRGDGKLLLDDKDGLEFSGLLYEFSVYRDATAFRDLARAIYLQAKPVSLLFSAEPVEQTYQYSDSREVLQEWSRVAPLFESAADVARQIRRLSFSSYSYYQEDDGEAGIRSSLTYAALITALGAGDIDGSSALMAQLEEYGRPALYFAGLLALGNRDSTAVPIADLMTAYSRCPSDDDCAVAFASYLEPRGYKDKARDILSELRHLRFNSVRNHSFGFTDVSYTVQLKYLQTILQVPEGDLPDVDSSESEAVARIEVAARQLGRLRAKSGESPRKLRDSFRSILLYQTQTVRFPHYDNRERFLLSMSKPEIYRELRSVAAAMGAVGLKALADVLIELAKIAPESVLTPHDRRDFARELFRAGTWDRTAAIKFALSSTHDAFDDDPATRQEACFDIAIFLNTVGDRERSKEWLTRSAQTTAGAGSHKDYHMAQIATWLEHSLSDLPTERELRCVEEFARALEVSGGAGQSIAASLVLRVILERCPSRACQLAIEFVDRSVMNLATATNALVCGGADAGASTSLLCAIYCRLLSLIHPSSTADAVNAILRTCTEDQALRIATMLMDHVRINSLPSVRSDIARSVQDEIRIKCNTEIDLLPGLPPGANDSSQSSSLYRLQAGKVRSQAEVAALLSEANRPEEWNPNPVENTDFDWWSAILKADITTSSHLEQLLERFSVPDYRSVEVLALRSKVSLVEGDQQSARRLAEEAIRSARDASWLKWLDGAQKVVALRALQALDASEARVKARREFGRDLSAGRLNSYYLMDNIVELFEFLEIDWPSEAAKESISDYVEQVLAASPSVPTYDCLTSDASDSSVDVALCSYLLELARSPIVEIGSAARRALGSYACAGGNGLVELLLSSQRLDVIQLEQAMIAMHVGSRDNKAIMQRLRRFVMRLNQHEAINIRGIARRICEEQVWTWQEVRDRRRAPILLMPRGSQGKTTWDDAERLVGGDVESAAILYGRIFELLERDGSDVAELRSEFMQLYWQIEASYPWSDRQRLRRWLRMALTRHWLRPRAIVGRAAALSLLGRIALSGQAQEGGEQAYDVLLPLYDPALELVGITERPSELRAMEWRPSGKEQGEWEKGGGAADWSSYPMKINGLHLIGERSWFIRPEWEWPRECRYRGIWAGGSDEELRHDALASDYELTYGTYLRGLAQHADQLVIKNSERQLEGQEYEWVGINSNVARDLGWIPASERPLEWIDGGGNTMVKTVFWRDGWTWLEPPRFEALGRGCFVVATDEGIDSIASAFPHAKHHLWVERQSGGENPFNGSWHLMRTWKA